jgi:hypothetical protein
MPVSRHFLRLGDDEADSARRWMIAAQVAAAGRPAAC